MDYKEYKEEKANIEHTHVDWDDYLSRMNALEDRWEKQNDPIGYKKRKDAKAKKFREALDKTLKEMENKMNNTIELNVNEVRYSYRFNRGNYEAEDIGISVQVQNGSFDEALQVCKNLVHGKKVTEGFKVETQEAAPAKTEEEKKEEQYEAIAPEEKVEAKEPAKKKVAKKKTAKKKVGKKKTTTRRKKLVAVPYDRTLDEHKKLMGELTAEMFGEEWKKDKELLSDVKLNSQLMNGVDFIGEDGTVLQSFKDEYKGHFEDK